MHRTSLLALGLVFVCGAPALAASPSNAPVRQVAYQVEEYVVPPAGVVYDTYSPVVPAVPYYSYRVAAPVYGPVYQYGPSPYYLPSTTVIRQRAFFGPRVRTFYRGW